MIPFEKAFEIVMGRVRPIEAERVDIGDARDRILAEDVRSDVDMPPFDKSAMDGYACRRADLGEELTILETIQAGYPPAKRVGQGECSKIMTGAMLPEGADCVIMVEHTVNPTARTVRFTGSETRDNIACRGEDVRVGDAVLRKGQAIHPQHVAMLASAGCVKPLVARRPRVGVIATGDELVEPDVKPAASQIRTSNGYQITAHVATAGALPAYYGIARDTEAEIDAYLKRALAGNDVVLLSGGVSMGDYDFVPDVLRKNGVEILFDSIAMKPGKPTTFGVTADAYCFGLPGNPVSTFIQCEILVKPFLYALMGHAFRPPVAVMPLAKKFTRKSTGREAWIPVSFTDEGGVVPNEYHGSAHIHALCAADGLIVVPAGVASVAEGTLVRVRPL